MHSARLMTIPDILAATLLLFFPLVLSAGSPDKEAVLFRGGGCLLANFKGSTDTQDKISGLSVQCWSKDSRKNMNKPAKKKADKMTEDNALDLVRAGALDYKKGCMAPVKDITSKGGTVVYRATEKNKDHCEISGLTAQELFDIFAQNKVDLIWEKR